MAKSTTREQLKSQCLRRLGAPVIKINVDDDQVDDIIDDALQLFIEYHMDAVEHGIYAIELTQNDIDNKYVTMPADIVSVLTLISDTSSGLSFTSDLYQIKKSIYGSVNSGGSGSLTSYYISMNYLGILESMLGTLTRIDFVAHSNKLNMYIDWSSANVGDLYVVECYKSIDPTGSPEIWNDRWLKDYATALIKRIWGSNMKKFKGVQLIGGIELNGGEVYSEAIDEIEKLELRLKEEHSLPVDFYVG